MFPYGDVATERSSVCETRIETFKDDLKMRPSASVRLHHSRLEALKHRAAS